MIGQKQDHLIQILDNLLESYTIFDGSEEEQAELRIHIQQLEDYLERENYSYGQ